MLPDRQTDRQVFPGIATDWLRRGFEGGFPERPGNIKTPAPTVSTQANRHISARTSSAQAVRTTLSGFGVRAPDGALRRGAPPGPQLRNAMRDVLRRVEAGETVAVAHFGIITDLIDVRQPRCHAA